MTQIVEPPVSGRRVAVRAKKVGRQKDWANLVRRAHAQGALEEVASWLGPGSGVDLILEQATRPPQEVASCAARVRAPGPYEEETAAIDGSPGWRLRVRFPAGHPLGREKLRSLKTAFEAWRAARAECDRAEGRLEARTRELDLLQTLGRSAAEARTADELFAVAACVLHRAGGEDLVVVVHALSGPPQAHAFLGRPMADRGVARAVRHGSDGLGFAPATPPRLQMERLGDFDEDRGLRDGVRASDLIVLPILRRGSPAATMVVLPSSAPEEGAVRLYFGVANQVSVQLDRILTVKEAEEDRFRSILDAMPQAVILADRSLRIVLANPAATNLLARLGPGGPSGTLGRIGDLEIPPLAAEVLAGGRSTVHGEAKPEEGVVLDVTITAVPDGAGRIEEVVLVLADVTESRRLQAQLAQAEKLSSLGQMISGIAHELNNPLASVLGYAQLVHASTSDDRLARRLEVVHREARRCQRIVQNFLSFARRHEPERKLLCLNEVVDSVIGLMAYQLRVDGVRVQCELDRDLPPILGDAHQLQQALLNLLTNAQHALRSEGGGGRLVVRTGSDRPGWVRLEVEDDGPGIPEAIRARIFDPFFTTKSPGHGTGLGLTIVYGVVASHEGVLRLDERSGSGATFRIELPVGAPGPVARAEAAPDARSAGDPAGRILVVDDEEPVARFICEALTEDGHHTVAAHDGGQALHRLAVEEFDLVISDMRMPGMTVEHLREEMNRLRPGLARELLLTTGDTVSREPDALAEREGLCLLHKPFDLDDLRRTVRSWLAANREHGPCDT